jgi:hypothetical protein
MQSVHLLDPLLALPEMFLENYWYTPTKRFVQGFIVAEVFFFFFAVLGFELRAFTLSHSAALL